MNGIFAAAIVAIASLMHKHPHTDQINKPLMLHSGNALHFTVASGASWINTFGYRSGAIFCGHFHLLLLNDVQNKSLKVTAI
jgi:hypothetical protein